MNRIGNGCLAMLTAAAFLAVTDTGYAARLPDSAIQLATNLNGHEGPFELARQLKATQDDTQLDRTVTDLARGIAASKNYGAAAKLVDNLTAQPDLRSSVIAGSLL